MALVRCPECGREISDAAYACPFCGYPVADAMEEKRRRGEEDSIRDIVCLMLKPYDMTHGTGGQTAEIKLKDGTVLWTGNVGEVAELYIPDTTEIFVRYKPNHMQYGGKCKGFINSKTSHYYCVTTEDDPHLAKKFAVKITDDRFVPYDIINGVMVNRRYRR